MMKISTSLSALALTAVLVSPTIAQAAIRDGQFVASTPKVGLLGQQNRRTGLDASRRGLMHAAPAPDKSFQAYSYGFLEGLDGTTWFYTQNNVPSAEYQGCYSSSTITLYDAKRAEKGSFVVEIPAGQHVNQIEPYGIVTNKLFDNKSATSEITIFLHEITPDYKGHEFVQVYSLDGTKVAQVDGDGMVVSSPINEWTPYQRFVSVSDRETDALMTDICVYRPASWGEDGMQLEHTFSLSSLLVNYMDAPFFNFFADGDKSCFVLTHYEKSFDMRDENGQMVLDPESYMPVFTPDNHFVVETYDRRFNRVDSFAVSTEVPSSNVMVRMMGLGAFTDLDISRGLFSDDGQLSYILMCEDVAIDTEYTYTFIAHTHTGQVIRALASDVGDFWSHLSAIPGCEEQILFLDNQGETLYTVDLPSFKEHALPSIIDEHGISTNLDRYAAADDKAGYRYVTGVRAADVDENNNVIAVYAHLNSDATIHHYVRFNLGPKAQTFTPLVNNQSLDPFLFNTDGHREYIFFSKLRYDDESSKGRNVLFIGNEAGQVLHQCDPAELNFDIWTAAIVNYGTPDASLLVNYYDPDTDENRLDFYGLPLFKFAEGGDGTEANPYLISSAGDLQLIEREPAAHYRVACDFDAQNYPVSVDEFSGVLDGAGHTIRNLCVTTNHYYGGLFGNTTGAVIRNLKLYHPTAVVGADNAMFGLIAGNAIETKIEQIAVLGMDVTSTGYTMPMGGLVGMAAAETVISECVVDDSSLAGSNTLGGLVGEMRTSSQVRASAVTDVRVVGAREVGGIAAVVGTGCRVSDCYVRADVTGIARTGGVVGSLGVNGNRSDLTRCVVDQTVVIDAGMQHSGFALVAGYLEPAWKSDTIRVSHCVVVNSYVVTPADTTAEGSSIHAVVGHTKANEPSEKEGEDMSEHGLADNYVYHDITPEVANAYLGGGTDATGVEGLTTTAEVLAPQSFWEGQTYAFGGTAPESAWLYEAGRLPWLWVMNESNAPSLLPVVTTLSAGEGMPLFYDLYGKRIAQPRGFGIVGGKVVYVP